MPYNGTMNLAKYLMKNPLLAIGVLMMVIMLYQLGDKDLVELRRAKLTPSSCRSLLVKLDRRIPENWKTACEGNNFNNLSIVINMPSGEQKDLRAYLYREMANYLIHVAQMSPSDNLELTDIIRLQLLHPKLEINAVSEGRFVVKLATLKDKKLIAQHLHSTVQVQEKASK